MIVREDNTFIDADGKWHYQSVEESVEEPIEELVEEPIEESVVPIQEVAVIAPESTLEVSQDISEIIPDAPESTLKVTSTLPDATQAVTLTKDEFIAKFGMRADTGEISHLYSKACVKSKADGYWTAPNGSRWTRTDEGNKAIWTQKTPVTV